MKLTDEISDKLKEMSEIGVVKTSDDDEPSEWVHALAFARKSSGE